MTLRLFRFVALQENELCIIMQNLGVMNLRFTFMKTVSDKEIKKNYLYTFELR
jgi:hypothetical protein